jgi:hypothetical protein
MELYGQAKPYEDIRVESIDYIHHTETQLITGFSAEACLIGYTPSFQAMLGAYVGSVGSLNPLAPGRDEAPSSGEGTSDLHPDDSAALSSVSSRNRTGARPTPARPTRIYIVVTVAIVVVVIILAYILSGGFHRPSGSATEVLLPSGTTYAIAQSTGLTLTVTTPSILQGMFQTGGVTVYTMSPSQYTSMVKTGNVSGYEWTSGPIAFQAFYNLSVSMAVGSWALVFVNPYTTATTAVTFYTAVTLTPT